MGMYDSVWLKCPKCERLLEAQSKAGDCHFKSYTQDDVPLDIAKSVWNDWVYCVDCNVAYRVRLADPPPMVIRMKLEVDQEF